MKISLSVIIIFSFCQFAYGQMIKQKLADAKVVRILSATQIEALTESKDFVISETIPVFSQNKIIGPIAYFRISAIEALDEKINKLSCTLVSYRGSYLVQIGDVLNKQDLSYQSQDYEGRTSLMIRSNKNVSSMYKPLYTQGVSIGETAESLAKDEVLVNYLGFYSYGIANNLTFDLNLPAMFLGYYYASLKYLFYQTDEQIISIQPSVIYSEQLDGGSGSVEVYWDSIGGAKQITHTKLKLAGFSYSREDKAKTAFLLGSSLQTGYEFILKSWNRVFIGPRYNFDLKKVGGYLSYMAIWDSYHLQLSLLSSNIESVKYSPEDGYYLSLDMFWRY